ncbi:ATP-binding protein [Streptomyces sp. HUAS MG91]|uniref:ATP-binding protein n=1 Tax=Streptomyces tabacisoli TaxID=3156398 RepID=A0AAU8IZY2_9ACTN
MRPEHSDGREVSCPPTPFAAAPLTLSGAETREVVRHAVLACLNGDAPETPATRNLLAEAQLVCSELVSNARRHGGGLYWFEAHARNGLVVIEVGDRSTRTPRSPRRDATEPGGFGWELVRRLSERVEVTVRPDGAGKIIRAVIRVV